MNDEWMLQAWTCECGFSIIDGQFFEKISPKFGCAQKSIQIRSKIVKKRIAKNG